MSAPIALSPAEFTACWDALGLGLPPAQLPGVGPGNGCDRRARRAALAALAARGLSDRATPCPELAGPLRLLAHPRYRLDLRWGEDLRGLVVGLGAVASDRATMVTSADGCLTVVVTDGARAAGALLGLLGPVTAGVGRPVNVPADVLDAATAAVRHRDLWELADRLEALGVSRLDTRSLVAMCQGMLGRGQLGATVTAGDRAHRAPGVIGVHLADAGWFTQIRQAGTVTICPTDPGRLLRRWRALIDTAAAVPPVG